MPPRALELIQHLLPNEHILNFHTNPERVILPDWLGNSLSLILGAGDMEHNGVLNIDELSMFDVFLCMPEDDEGSLRRNVEAFLKKYHHQKVLCFLDTQNDAQMKRICQLFLNRFCLVDGHGGHTPHLPINCIATILEVGGTAVSLYERNNLEIDEVTLTTILDKNVREITDRDAINLMSSVRMYSYNSPAFEREMIHTYRLVLQDKIFQKQKTNRSIDVKWADLPKEDDRETIYPYLSCLAALIRYDPLPPTLKGVFKANTRIWQPDFELKELVVTKVAAGGKRKTRKQKGKRKQSRKN